MYVRLLYDKKKSTTLVWNNPKSSSALQGYKNAIWNSPKIFIYV